MLIVADDAAFADIAEAVRRVGADPVPCGAGDLAAAVEASATLPSAVVLVMGGRDVGRAMAALRRSRRGAVVPVVLVGTLGRDVADVAEVLDLGADHFVERSEVSRDLAPVLAELAGTADEGTDGTATAVLPDAPPADRTLVLEDGARPRAETGHGGALRRVRQALEHVDRSRADGEPEDLPDGLALVAPEGPADSGVRPVDAELSEVFPVDEPHPARTEPAPVDPSGRTDPSIVPRAAVDASAAGPTPVPVVGAFVPVRRALGTLPIPREGDLSDLEPARLFAKLHGARFGGRVDFELPAATKSVWLVEGVVVSARGSGPQDRLLSGLLAQGRLTRAQYEAACRLVAKDPRRAGTLLVESGYLDAAELPGVLRNHVRDVAAEVLRHLEGRFHVVPDAEADVPITFDLPPHRFLLEGVDRFVPRPALRAAVGPDAAALLRPSWPPPRDAAYDVAAWTDAFGLSPDECDLVAALDGTQRLCDLEDAWAGRCVRFWPLVYVLHVFEALDLLAEPVGVQGRSLEAIAKERVLDVLDRVRTGDPFEILGVDRAADAAAVARAATDLRATFSDRALPSTVCEAMAEALEEIRTAIDQAEAILSDEALRLAYLAQLETS